MTTPLPESEGPMRGWLRANAGISAVVDSRVYFGMPEQDEPTLPFLIFYRAGGLPDDMGHDYPDYIIECWGENKNAAANLGKTVAQEIMMSNHRPPVEINGAHIKCGTVNSGPLPNGGTSRAKRYRLDVSMMMRAV